VLTHPALFNALFATIQLALAAGLLWRRTTRLALAGSLVWTLGVWWLGEGLGGLLTGTAHPVTGAPGAGQHLGGMFTGSGTDPSTGPLLVLLAAAYWPLPQAGQQRIGQQRAGQLRADDHSFLAANGPVMRSSSGSVAAMTASDSTSPASTLR
jgi:hypothetical protein